MLIAVMYHVVESTKSESKSESKHLDQTECEKVEQIVEVGPKITELFTAILRIHIRSALRNHPTSSGALVSALVVRGKRQLVVYFTCIHEAFM